MLLKPRPVEVKVEPIRLDMITAFLNDKKIGYNLEKKNDKTILTVGETGEKVILTDEEVEQLSNKTRAWLDARRAEIMKGIGL